MSTFLESSYHRLTNSKNMLIILVYVFVAVTFFTTFNGVVSYIFGSWDKASMLSLVIFGIVLFCIQAYLLLRSTYHVIEFRNNGFFKNVSWFLIWVFTFVFSATFSYTFYYDKLSADAHGKRVIEQQINIVVANAEKYLQSFEDVATEMNDLSNYSQNTAQKEEKKGGTCEGDRSPPGPGPRIRYRQKDQRIFRLQAMKVSQLHTKVGQEIKLFQQQKQKFSKNIITTIPELEQAFNASVARLNTYNSQHPVLVGVLNKLNNHYGRNRKTDGMNSNGTSIYCLDSHINQSINEVKQRLNAIQPIDNVALFDRSNRRELQNRVVEVFLSPFQSASKASKNDFNKYDYIALALGFLVESLMFVITFILHNGDNSYPVNKHGYIGEWFSSVDAKQLQERLQVEKQDLIQVMSSARKHQLGYFIIADIEHDFCPIINALDRKGLFTKKLNAIEFGSLDKKIQRLEYHKDDKMVNLYFSPNKMWMDYRMSLDHLRDNA